jgi:beta-galactosidase
LSRVLAAYGPALVAALPVTVTTIGFQLNDYLTEVNNSFTREATRLITHQREELTFDFLGKGLAVSHRPFDALELGQATLDSARTPTLWVMLEKICPPTVQQKLVDYARAGGQLVIVGRLPSEGADHQPCVVLQEALGVETVTSDAPFVRSEIDALGHRDIPVQLVESYTGVFAEVIATRGDEIVGFGQPVGAGRVLVFGASLGANTLDDLDLVEQLAQRLDCARLLTVSPWADARLSRGEQGNFLYLNNYLDDPVDTNVALEGVALFGGHPVHVPARQGQILPLDWQVRPGVTMHYATAEFNGVTEAGGQLVLTTRLPEVYAELLLDGYTCAGATPAADGRVTMHVTDGHLVLTRV